MRQIIPSLLLRNRVNFRLYQANRFISDYVWDQIIVQQIDLPNSRDLRKTYAQLKIAVKSHIFRSTLVKESGNKNGKDLEDAVNAAKRDQLSTYFITKALEPKTSAKHNLLMSLMGPDNMIILLHISTPQFDDFQASLSRTLRAKVRSVTPNKRNIQLQKIFDEIYTIVCQKDCSLDEATYDALQAGADDIEEVVKNDKKYFVFTVLPTHSIRCEQFLINQDYDILFSQILHEPKRPVSMDNNAKETLDTLAKTVLKIPGVKLIEHNLQ